MSDEKIQIELVDKIASSIETKIEAISVASERAYTHLERLKAALKIIDVGPLNQLAAGYSKAQKAINDAAISSARLRTEEQKTSAATIQAALTQQKLQTAATQTALAQQQLATATQRANAAQAQTATATANAAAAHSRAAQAALRLQNAQQSAAQSAGAMQREAESLKRSLFPLYAAQQEYNVALARANALLQSGAIDQKVYSAAVQAATTKLVQATGATNNFTGAQNRMGTAAKINRAHLTNLGFQLNDIGVSLAGGQNPLIVLIQQGSQIAGIASQAGVGLGALAKAAFGMIARFIPVTIAIGAVVGAIRSLNAEASKQGNLKEFAEGLGATKKQIKSLDLDVVTFGNSMRGLWKTIADATLIDEGISRVWGIIKDFFKTLLKVAAIAITSLVALFQAAFDTIIDLWQTFPRRFVAYIANTVNDAIAYFEFMGNAGITAANKIIEALNSISGVKIEPFKDLKLDRIDTSKILGDAKPLVDSFVDSYTKNLEKNQAKVVGFLADWQKNSIEAAKKRIKTSLNEDKTTENRAAALAKVNAQLDNELDRMMLLKPVREEAARFDAIEEQLLGKKIKLSAEEAKSIKAKIAAILANKDVQAAMDRIYEDSTGALRNLNAVQSASTILVAKGTITLEESQRAITGATEAYLNSIAPLRQFNKEMDDQLTLLAMLPREREIEQKFMQIRNEQLSKGIVLEGEAAKAVRARLADEQRAIQASQSEADVWESTVGVREKYIADLTAIAKLKAAGTISGPQATQKLEEILPEGALEGTRQKAQAEIDILQWRQKQIDLAHQNGLLSEQAYRQAMIALVTGTPMQGSAEQIKAEIDLLNWRQEQIDAAHAKGLLSETQYAQASIKISADRFATETQNASRFFGGLSGLMNSENQKLFKIGKAAALANAVIQGTQSVMNAMAIQPWYVGAALAVVAAANAAQQISQIRSAKPPSAQGFMRGGYTGNKPTNQEAGVVHGQEFVMNAGATARIGVDNLQALQRGAANVQTSTGGGGIKVSIANYGTSKDFEVQQLSPEEVRIIARDESSKQIAKDTPKLVSAQIGEANSPISKSLSKHTLAARRR